MCLHAWSLLHVLLAAAREAEALEKLKIREGRPVSVLGCRMINKPTGRVPTFRDLSDEAANSVP